MSEKIFTDDNFKQEVLGSKDVVLVDFFAEWCGPCRAMEPTISELAQDYLNKGVVIGKLNVDQNQQTPAEYQVMSIPNLILFKNGQVQKQLIGLQEKAVLKAEIDKLLS